MKKTSKIKTSKEQKRNTSNPKSKNKVPLWRRISVRLIASFLIPVVFIVVLGVVSYQKANTQITSTYQESVEQTVRMMNQYLNLAFDTVQSNYKSYVNNEDLQMYYNGNMDNDPTKQHNTVTSYEDKFIELVTKDNMLANFYVLANNGNIYYEDYEHFDAMTVGVLSTCSQTAAIEELGNEKGFSVNIRYYATTDALEKALTDGEVDAIYTITVSNGSAFRIVAHFPNTHLYFATPKGSSLLSELTDAQKIIRDTFPYFEYELFEDTIRNQLPGVRLHEFHLYTYL